MPEKETKYFIKNETSVSANNGEIGNYTGIGASATKPEGTFEVMFASKFSNSSNSQFTEFKYTSPKIGKNISIQSRARLITDSKSPKSLTERLTLNTCYKNGLINIYENAGLNSKFIVSGENAGLTSITPTSLTGVGYNVTNNFSIYGECEISKTYNVKSKNWGKISPAFYFGTKLTF